MTQVMVNAVLLELEADVAAVTASANMMVGIARLIYFIISSISLTVALLSLVVCLFVDIFPV